jgi:hypothetical protein
MATLAHEAKKWSTASRGLDIGNGSEGQQQQARLDTTGTGGFTKQTA